MKAVARLRKVFLQKTNGDSLQKLFAGNCNKDEWFFKILFTIYCILFSVSQLTKDTLKPTKDKKLSTAKLVKGFGLKREKSLKSNGSNSSSTSQPQTAPTPATPVPQQVNAVPNRGARPTSLTLTQNPFVPPNTTPIGPGSPISGSVPSYVPSQRLNRVPEDEWIEDPYFYEDYISEDEIEDYSTKPVPIWLSILLVLIYIGFGAYIFRVRIGSLFEPPQKSCSFIKLY